MENKFGKYALVFFVPFIASGIEMSFAYLMIGNLKARPMDTYDIVANTVISLIAGPVTEECIFRFLPIKFVRNGKLKFMPALILSSVIFSAVHGFHFLFIFSVFKFLTGGLFFVVCYKYGLPNSIKAHAMHNLLPTVLQIIQNLL